VSGRAEAYHELVAYFRCTSALVALLGLIGCTESPSARSGPASDTAARGEARSTDLARTESGALVSDVRSATDGYLFPSRSGKATYYPADGSGNCGFDASPSDLMVAAANSTDYASSEACGECVSVVGPKGTVVVRIVDSCPGCEVGQLDLSEEAFAKIADLTAGKVSISWRIVPCSVSGPVVYHFKDGSSKWWTAIQLRQTRYPIKSLEAMVSGSYQSLARTSYNYFLASSGLGSGPYTLRVTDVVGHALVDTGIVLTADADVKGAAQLPL
jgi:expansin